MTLKTGDESDWRTRQDALGGSKHVMVDVTISNAGAKQLMESIPDLAKGLGIFDNQAPPVVQAAGALQVVLIMDHDTRSTLTARFEEVEDQTKVAMNVMGGHGVRAVDQAVVETFVSRVKAHDSESSTKAYPVIARHARFDPYVATSDDLFVEYDFTETVFEHDSQYQNIKIMKSTQFGNVLLLDDDPNLAESDEAYTLAITGQSHKRIDYTDKDVLIIGGGDGGILRVLREQGCKSIVMLEIDDVVIDASTKYLRGICNDKMDELVGEGYEVRVGDCIPSMKAYAAEGKVFDAVINDLTAIPVTTTAGKDWEFVELILQLSIKLLAKDGSYYTQGNGANMRIAREKYETLLDSLSPPVTFTKESVCVPSYHEMWLFYSVKHQA